MNISDKVKLLFFKIRQLLSRGRLKEAKKKLNELLLFIEDNSVKKLSSIQKEILDLCSVLNVKIKKGKITTKQILNKLDLEIENLIEEKLPGESTPLTNSKPNNTKSELTSDIFYDLKNLEKVYSKKQYDEKAEYKSLSYELLEKMGIMALINQEQPENSLENIVPEVGDLVKILFVKPEEYANIRREQEEIKNNYSNHENDSLQRAVKENETLEGILVAVEGYTVTKADLQNSSKTYRILAKNSKTGELEEHYIQNNSVLAILDKALTAEGKNAVYEMQFYTDSDTGKEASGLLLTGVKEYNQQASKEFQDERNTGVLGFINREEPGSGTIPIDTLVPDEGDSLSLAYVLQGTYKGNYGECESCVPLEKLE